MLNFVRHIPSPFTMDVGDEVNIDQISRKGVKIYPGFVSGVAKTAGEDKRDAFLNAFVKHRGQPGGNDIEVIQNLLFELSQKGAQWLDAIVDLICGQAGKSLPSLNLFKKRSFKSWMRRKIYGEAVRNGWNQRRGQSLPHGCWHRLLSRSSSCSPA